MPITGLEIIDSAVKIGLGATISAIATYIALKASHAHDKSKDSRAHKIKSLEMISEKCDVLFIAFGRYQGALGGVLKNRPTNDEFPLADDQLERLITHDLELFAARDGVHSGGKYR